MISDSDRSEGADTPERESFDALWTQAEALLPEGVLLEEVTRWHLRDDQRYAASAWSSHTDSLFLRGIGGSPEAAVRDLIRLIEDPTPSEGQ